MRLVALLFALLLQSLPVKLDQASCRMELVFQKFHLLTMELLVLPPPVCISTIVVSLE
jgi:hypothetical protein